MPAMRIWRVIPGGRELIAETIVHTQWPFVDGDASLGHAVYDAIGDSIDCGIDAGTVDVRGAAYEYEVTRE